MLETYPDRQKSTNIETRSVQAPGNKLSSRDIGKHKATAFKVRTREEHVMTACIQDKHQDHS